MKIAIAAGIVAVVGIYLVRRINSVSNLRRLKKVSDDGYETASDVLYPGKNIGSSKLRYGPVVPRR